MKITKIELYLLLLLCHGDQPKGECRLQFINQKKHLENGFNLICMCEQQCQLLEMKPTEFQLHISFILLSDYICKFIFFHLV